MKRNKNSTAYKLRIGNNIRKWRNIKDIKQKDLATALRISEASVSNIENDVTNITLGQLGEIALALDVSIEQLFTDPQEKIRNTAFQAQAANDPFLPDRELLNAIIESLEKKDQQLQVIMQNFLHTITALMQHEQLIFSSSKQVAPRA